MIRVAIENVGEMTALLDTGASVTAVRKGALKGIRLKSKGMTPGLRGIDNKIIQVVDEISLNVRWSGSVIRLEKVAVVESAPFPLILGVDWLTKANLNLVCKDNKIIPVRQTQEKVDDEEKHSGDEGYDSSMEMSDELFEDVEKELPTRRRKGVVKFTIDGPIDVPGESLRMLRGSIPVRFNGTGMVRFGFSAEPAKTWIVPSALVTFKNGRAKVPLLNLESEKVTIGKRSCQILIDLDMAVQLAVVRNEKPAKRSVPTCVAVQSAHEAIDKRAINMAGNLTDREEYSLIELLDKHRGCLPSESNELGYATDIEHRIDTGDAPPIANQPYRVSQYERRIISEKVSEMLKDGVIQPSNSPWSSPVVLVRKKSGEHRFCIDYRRLNNVTKRDVYPLPRMDDVFDRLAGAQYFSTLDLKNGYWQVPVAGGDRQKTAFITPDGLYEFTRLPFGLSNAPATFQRLMDRVLNRLKWTACLVYLDDILVFGRTFEEHQERLDLVLNALCKAKLILNLEKCLFAAGEVKHLGHIISASGIRPDPEKIGGLVNMRVNSVKSVRAFLGLASFYRKFIPDFASLSSPLTALLKKNAKWRWAEEQKAAVSALTNRLLSSPILAHYDEKLPIEIHTDACNTGLGAVLVQKTDSGLSPISFISRSLSPAESKYHSNELECLALVWALKKFRCYVYGRSFTVRTDNSAVKWLWDKKELSGKFSRWILSLQEFDFKIEHIKGKGNIVADVLSRNPDESRSGPGESSTEHRVCCMLKSDGYTPQELAYLQQIDDQLRPITNKILTNPKNDPNFVVKKGVVYKKNDSKLGRKLLLLVPSVMRRDLIKNFHDESRAGHLGVEKTLARIRENYYWPRLEKSVRVYVSSCVHCQFHKTPPGSSVGFLQPIPPPARPFEMIGMDHIGPLKLSPTGNLHILVAIDYLTKWVEAAAVPTTATCHVVKFLRNYVINRHGVPARILTDQGSAFTSEEMELEANRWHIKQIFATPEHPQTNGLVERVNRTTAQALAAFISPTHADWDDRLPDAVFAINSAKQSTVQYSPFQLVYGRLPTHAVDNLFEWPSDRPATQREFERRVARMRRAARLNTINRQRRSKKLTDARRRAAKPLVPGDLVLVRRRLKKKGLTRKFMPKYVGPFQVVQRVAITTYLVEDLSASRKRKRWRRFHAHVAQLKLFRARSDSEWCNGDSDGEEEEESTRMDTPEAESDTLLEEIELPIPPPPTPPPPPPPALSTRGRRLTRPRYLDDYDLGTGTD